MAEKRKYTKKDEPKPITAIKSAPLKTETRFVCPECNHVYSTYVGMACPKCGWGK